MVHGDDFISVGDEESLRTMQRHLESEFEITTTVIGPEAKDQKEARVLNRTIRFTAEGIEYQPDPRHAEIIIRDLKLEQCNPV